MALSLGRPHNGCMSFREYIARRRVTDTPTGDFTRHAKADPSLPDAQSWADVEAYALGMGRRGAVAAARSVWRSYRRYSRGR